MLKCPDCSKEFENEGPLNQHRIAKHDFKTIEKKQINYKRIFSWGVVILIVLFVIYLIFKPIGYVPLPYMENSIGSKDAPVTVIEFSDFECPACKYFWSNVETQFKEELVDTGKVRFVYKHFPLPQHKYAFKAAEASECAADQGKFWEYHDKLFENQLECKNATDHKAMVVGFAKDLNLDVNKFESCLNSNKYLSEVENDIEAGKMAKIQGTPTFFINNRTIIGPKPIKAFKEIINEELRR